MKRICEEEGRLVRIWSDGNIITAEGHWEEGSADCLVRGELGRLFSRRVSLFGALDNYHIYFSSGTTADKESSLLS